MEVIGCTPRSVGCETLIGSPIQRSRERPLASTIRSYTSATRIGLDSEPWLYRLCAAAAIQKRWSGAEMAVCLASCYVHTMVKRKSHNLDEQLLRRAQRVLGADTETETIHQALRAVLIGEQILADLRAAVGPGTFRPVFIRRLRHEMRAR